MRKEKDTISSSRKMSKISNVSNGGLEGTLFSGVWGKMLRHKGAAMTIKSVMEESCVIGTEEPTTTSALVGLNRWSSKPLV